MASSDAGARGTRRRVERIDERDPGADGETDGPARAQRRADQEERHRAELHCHQESPARIRV
jgi:hypothetical protein